MEIWHLQSIELSIKRKNFLSNNTDNKWHIYIFLHDKIVKEKHEIEDFALYNCNTLLRDFALYNCNTLFWDLHCTAIIHCSKILEVKNKLQIGSSLEILVRRMKPEQDLHTLFTAYMYMYHMIETCTCILMLTANSIDLMQHQVHNAKM